MSERTCSRLEDLVLDTASGLRRANLLADRVLRAAREGRLATEASEEGWRRAD